MGKKIAIAAAVLLVVAGLAAGFVLGKLGRIVERGVETAGPQITGTDVSLGSASISIFSGEGSLKRLHVGNPEGYSDDDAFDLGEVSISVDPKSVVSKVVHVRSIVVDGPQLLAEFEPGGTSNLQKIMDHVRAVAGGGGGSGKGGEPGGAQTKMIVDEFRFENAQVRALAPALNVDRTLKLPPVVLRNLGARQGGAAASEIANQVMKPIVDAALRQATQEYIAAQRAKFGEKAKDKLMDKLFK